MLLSLGSYFNTGVLTVHFVGATPKHRQWRDVAVWSGSENISEAEKGSTGTRESLTSPHVKRGIRSTARSRDRVTQGTCCSCSNDKNKQQALSGICTEGNRREGEGRRKS